MYAIFEDGGRQFKVHEGQELDLDYRDLAAGTELKFDRVLACGSGAEAKLGRPVVEGAAVTAEVLGISQGPKLTIQKFRRRKNSRRRTGHRQMYTRIRISKIVGV